MNIHFFPPGFGLQGAPHGYFMSELSSPVPSLPLWLPLADSLQNCLVKILGFRGGGAGELLPVWKAVFASDHRRLQAAN